MSLSSLATWTLDLVFPKHCVGCGEEGAYLCSACQPQLAFGTPSCLHCSQRNFDGVTCSHCQKLTEIRRFLAPFSYREALVRELIHAYKYEGLRELAKLFSEEIAGFLKFYGVRIPASGVLVPIPLHRGRESERGFNQAELLARDLSRRLGVPVVKGLRRTRHTEQQINMPNYEARRANIRGAFALSDPTLIHARTVVLIDDVATSGGTLSEAARVIREAGARTVWAITIAKG